MDDLRGIDGTCSSQPARGTKPRRASSISLDPEDDIGALQPHCVASAAIMPHQSQTSGSAKSPLLLLRPQELHFVDGKSPPSPPEGCPLLPSQPDLTSSPCLSPLQGWLVNKSDREQRMLGLPDSPGIDGKASISESQPVGTMSDKDDTSSKNSSWDLVEYNSDAARRCASPKRNEDPVTASQELARGREDRSKAPSPEQQTVEAEPPSPASSIMLGDAPIPEHATTRFAHLNEQLQPIGGLGDNTRSLIRYHRAHDRRGQGRVKKQTKLRKRHKG